MSDIDGALRFLRRKTSKETVKITETHFAILIQMCSKTTNYLIAAELFHIMKSHYNIIPTGKSVAALMDVYIESGLYEKALSLFDEYTQQDNKVSRDDEMLQDNVISVYNKAILVHIKRNEPEKCESLFEKVTQLQIPTDSPFYKMMIQYMIETKKDYPSALDILDKLLTSDTVQATTSHFEVIMAHCNHISYHEGIFQLYKKMNEYNVPMNSRILYYLIKSTFKVNITNKEGVDNAIELLNEIMENVARGTMNVTINRLHPSVMAWPMRVITKYYSPKDALNLFNKYHQLFYGKDDTIMSNKFSILRSFMVLFAEIEQWEQFERVYEKFLARLETIEQLPSHTVKNSKLKGLFIGIISYKIRQLNATQQIDKLPGLVENLQSRGFILDNKSWNDVILALFQDPRTIHDGLKLVNDKFIHGFNLIHKYRFLKNKKENAELRDGKEPWLLSQKEKDPNSFQPKLYLKSDVYLRIMESLDGYLNSLGETHLDDTIKSFLSKYGYFMKSYLMTPRINVTGWESFENDHMQYLQQLRQMKRIVPLSEY